LLAAVLSAGAALGLVSSAAASTPQLVTIDNAFYNDPQSPGCGVNSGVFESFSATGGIFPHGVASGTNCVITFRATHVPNTFDHSIVNTAHRTDVYTPNDGSGTFTFGLNYVGTFLAGFEGGPNCPVLPNGDQTYVRDQCNTIVYRGSATVKGGTGRYTNLRGTLDFTSQEIFDVNQFEVIEGTEHLVGSLHIDP
jgi:hypothetical protein